MRFGIPNQDAIDWRPRGGAVSAQVMAVADGHGATLHFRSALGAHMAVEAALRVLSPLATENTARDATALSAIARDIISDWRAQVSRHIEQEPLPQEALSRGIDQFTPYGTTLIAAAVGPAGAILIQIGDGDLLLGRCDGQLVRPLPDDVGLIGEQTYSLCQPQAEDHMRVRWIGAEALPFDFLLLATDGLSKSFSDDDAFRAVAAYWRETIARDGLETALRQLASWMSQTSLEGSGDDITVGVIVSGESGGAEASRQSGSTTRTLPSAQRRTQNSLRRVGGAGRRVVAAVASAMAVAAIVAVAYVFVAS